MQRVSILFSHTQPHLYSFNVICDVWIKALIGVNKTTLHFSFLFLFLSTSKASRCHSNMRRGRERERQSEKKRPIVKEYFNSYRTLPNI